MKIIFNLFLVLGHTEWLFQGRHLIGLLEWRQVILNLAGNSFHFWSRTASDMTCKLGITFVDESKDFYVEKSGQSSCWRAKWSWLVGVGRRKRFRLYENCLLRSSLYQYISNQQPIVLERQLSLPATSTHTRELWYRRLGPTVDTQRENRFKVGSDMNVWPPNIWILRGR